LGPEKAAASVPFGSDIRILVLRGAFTNVRTSETLVKLIDLVWLWFRSAYAELAGSNDADF
jgi:hypothetical protein